MSKERVRYSFEPGADLTEFLRTIDSPTSFLRRVVALGRELGMHLREGGPEFAVIRDKERLAMIDGAYEMDDFLDGLHRFSRDSVSEAWQVLLNHGFSPRQVFIMVSWLDESRWMKPASVSIDSLRSTLSRLPNEVLDSLRPLTLSDDEHLGALALVKTIGLRESHSILVLVDECIRGNRYLRGLMNEVRF